MNIDYRLVGLISVFDKKLGRFKKPTLYIRRQPQYSGLPGYLLPRLSQSRLSLVRLV